MKEKKKRTPEQMKVIREYDAKTYQLVQIKPKIEEAEMMREYAKKRGESLTRLVVRSVEMQMEQDAQIDAKFMEMITEQGLETELTETLDEILKDKKKRPAR